MWVDRVDGRRRAGSTRQVYATEIRDAGQKHRRQADYSAPRSETAVRVAPLLPSLPGLFTGLRAIGRCLRL